MAEISPVTQIPSVEQLVSRFAARERKPIKTLEAKKTSLNRRSAVLTDLKSKLSSLRSLLKGFTDVGTAAKLAAKSASSSDESIFTVEADATAASGVNTLFVSRIAKHDLAVSSEVSENSTSIAEEFNGTTQVFTIQIGSGTVKTISIAFTDESETNEDVLVRIAEEINNSVDDVSATVISNKKDKNRFTIIASESGSENAISLADADDSELLKELGFISDDDDDNDDDVEVTRKAADKIEGGFITPDSDDLDAIFELNGIEITSSSNTITDVLKGVTIQLRKAQETGGEPETFTVSPDSGATIDQIKEFIEEYNDSLEFLTEKISVDTENEKRGVLAGNFTFINLRLKLREIVSESVSGVASGDPSRLTEIGIKINNDGTLEIDDQDKLESAFEENATAVTELFTGETGIAEKLIDLLDTFTLAGKTIDIGISSITRQTRTIDTQISRFESRFRFREESLRQKFTQLERALALLNSQQAALQRFGFSSGSLFQFGTGSLLSQRRNLL